ncbi:helix-turn-helix domain-containing protein [Botrimarina sp.]|uniref:helix-turn-helix domain-containing protein n=1 Tax=Botrimarina sp. TaxID=2795802 RepID=UPI0032EF51F0
MTRTQELPAHKTLPEVAKRYGVSEKTVRGWHQSGKLKVVRFGRSIRVPDAEIERIDRDGISLH